MGKQNKKGHTKLYSDPLAFMLHYITVFQQGVCLNATFVSGAGVHRPEGRIKIIVLALV